MRILTFLITLYFLGSSFVEAATHSFIPYKCGISTERIYDSRRAVEVCIGSLQVDSNRSSLSLQLIDGDSQSRFYLIQKYEYVDYSSSFLVSNQRGVTMKFFGVLDGDPNVFSIYRLQVIYGVDEFNLPFNAHIDFLK